MMRQKMFFGTLFSFVLMLALTPSIALASDGGSNQGANGVNQVNDEAETSSYTPVVMRSNLQTSTQDTASTNNEGYAAGTVFRSNIIGVTTQDTTPTNNQGYAAGTVFRSNIIGVTTQTAQVPNTTWAGTASSNISGISGTPVLRSNTEVGSTSPSVSSEEVQSPYQAYIDIANGYSSYTPWIILVDRADHKVVVLNGAQGSWSVEYCWSCVTGTDSTPTVTGVFQTTGFKRSALTTDRRAIYCTQVWSGYFIHSVLESTDELGQSLSHGCIRLDWPNAQWIYDNIGVGTTVVIYN